jgi:hypothetical protein
MDDHPPTIAAVLPDGQVIVADVIAGEVDARGVLHCDVVPRIPLNQDQLPFDSPPPQEFP